MIENVALVVASAAKRSQNIECRLSVQRILIVDLTQILEACFVHDLRAKNLRIADLQRVLGGFRVIALRRQVERADALVILSVVEVLVTRRESVVLTELIINSGSDVGAMSKVRDRLDKWDFGEGCGIKYQRVYGGEVIDISTLGIDEE